MKSVWLILVCALLIVGISLPAYAAVDDLEELPSDPEQIEDVTVEDPVPDDEPALEDPESAPEDLPEEDPATESSQYDDSGYSGAPVVEYSSHVVVRDAAEYSSDYSASLMGAIYAVFGEYTPRTYDVTTYLDDGTAIQSTEIVPGLAGLDFNWLAGVSLFALSLFCIFRMIGGMFRWK